MATNGLRCAKLGPEMEQRKGVASVPAKPVPSVADPGGRLKELRCLDLDEFDNEVGS